MANDLKDYSITLSVSPSAILSNFDKDEQKQLLEHFGSAEKLTDWIMSGICDYFRGDGFEYELDGELWNISDQLDAENRGEQIYF